MIARLYVSHAKWFSRRVRASERLTLRVALGAVAWLAVASFAPAARADDDATAKRPSDAAAVAKADALFDAAKKLMAQGPSAEACDMLAESQRLDPGGGTILALALCHEGIGRLATARAELDDALAVATKDGDQNRVAVAREKIAAIEPKLARLTIRLAPAVAALDGLEVVRDGATIAADARERIAMDPGAHHVVVRAANRIAFERDVTIGASPGETIVAVDALEPVRAPPVAPPPSAPAEPSKLRRDVGIAAFGAGVVAIGVGAVLGARAIAENDDANKACPGTCADPGAVAASHRAGSLADAATATIVAGAAVAAVGGVLFLTARSSKPPLVTSLGPIRVGPRHLSISF